MITNDRLKKLIHDAMTQYSADQFLKGEKVDSVKQFEFVGIFVAVEVDKECKKDAVKEIIDFLTDWDKYHSQINAYTNNKYPDYKFGDSAKKYLKKKYTV